MQKSTLIRQLSALSAEERRALRKFLDSPYHNQREDVRSLYGFIDQHLDKRWDQLDKETAFEYVYRSAAYDLKQMRYLMSFLLKVVEDFLIHREATRDQVEAQALLLKAYRRRKLPGLFRKTLKRSRDLHARSFLEEKHYELAYRIELENYLFTAGSQRELPSQLPVLNQSLDTLYFCRRLRQSCLLQAHQAVFREEEDPRLLHLLMPYLEDSPFLETPLIAIYFYYLKAVQEPANEKYYRLFRKHFLANRTQLPKEERRTMILLAINYGIQRFNLGEEDFLREVFEWYQAGLEDRLLLENGRLSRFAFKNIVGIGLRLGELEWTKVFIDDFQQALSPKYRDNYVHFSLSKLRYTQGRHQEAMQRLVRVEYDDLYLNLDAKVLLMKIYYELDEWQALDSLLTSVQRFIRRKKLMGYHRDNYLSIVRFIRKLTGLNPFDRAARQQLRAEIEQSPALGEREWLLEQV